MFGDMLILGIRETAYFIIVVNDTAIKRPIKTGDRRVGEVVGAEYM